MKASEVLHLLNISRQTLCKYVKMGKIKVTKTISGVYDYDYDSVTSLISKIPRLNVIYARVSTSHQKNDLNNQIDLIRTYCNSNGINVDNVFSDIDSGMTIDRKDFSKLLQLITQKKVSTVFISYKDRLSRLSFPIIEKLFSEFGTKIVIINGDDDKKTIETEIMHEIISILHCYSMKMYSNRRKKKLDLIKNDLILESTVNLEQN